MKFFSLILFCLLGYSALSQEVGECLPNPSSKKYLTYDFTAPFPKVVTFTCDYECKNLDGLTTLNAQRSVRVTSSKDEGFNLVCLGVKIKTGRWGVEFDKLVPFFAHNSQMTKIKAWAYASNISVDHPASKELMKSFKETLRQVSSSYTIAGTSNTPISIEFENAAKTMNSILGELPENTESLDHYVSILEENRGIIDSQMNAESLVQRFVLTFARWRLSF
ncbi:hypothetical protein A9Q84_01725 [Halobacteriovorax marinus]|uniref:Uncharacterized protein n=1 Tax=Halobacteriovorax marinus TaxID=97084 RepID=A0A1Y5FC41_9BACT|nr:hypothetical protein A9Q84_01725 [Halobacteriovorax marinus]